MKPTKEQIKGAIAMIAECSMSDIKYDPKKKEFSFFERLYAPLYDDGFGIDAMDIEEVPRTMGWKEAQSLWREYKNMFKPSKIVASKNKAFIHSTSKEDFELPF